MTGVQTCALPISGVVPKLSETPGDIDWIGPALGEHTDSVLRALGYADADIERMRKAGTI